MHKVNKRNVAPLHEILFFPETSLPYFYMVQNKNIAPLNVLSSVQAI